MDCITWTREKPNMRLGETARVCQEEVCVIIGYGALGKHSINISSGNEI